MPQPLYFAPHSADRDPKLHNSFSQQLNKVNSAPRRSAPSTAALLHPHSRPHPRPHPHPHRSSSGRGHSQPAGSEGRGRRDVNKGRARDGRAPAPAAARGGAGVMLRGAMASPEGAGGAGGVTRLTVRKDLFPAPAPHGTALEDPTLGTISCVKLETDFELSIDEIAQARAPLNGRPPPRAERRRSAKRRRRRHRSATTEDDSDDEPLENGRRAEQIRRKRSREMTPRRAKGGKNLNLVSSSKDEDEDEEADSDDETLQSGAAFVRPRSGGKPYSHSLSQLSSKRRKSVARRSHAVIPSSGKPRSMMGICSSKSKKKSSSKKSGKTPTYQSQIVDTGTIKLKIRKSSFQAQVQPISIANLGQRKSKKKKCATPLASASSGEEYDPMHPHTASVSVAALKSRNLPTRPKKEERIKKEPLRKKDKMETPKLNKPDLPLEAGPQSPWGSTLPVPVLTKIFEYVTAQKGTLPTILKLGRVCKLWQSIACQPVLWRHVELSTHTADKFKTDFRLCAMLENRLTMCNSLNLAHWKVSNLPWVVACLVDYCPGLVELNLTAWSRLTPEHLRDLVQGLTKLQRLDLSLIAETGGSGSCLSAASMAHMTELMADRLTHLSLANNMFTALQQILTSIATHCYNLEVLDISGAKATSHPAFIPLEALQKGCSKLRVFRAANSQVVLAPSTSTQQVEAPGFPCLEELSIAAETSGSGVGEYRLDDEALERIVRGATRLKLLDLRGLTRISDSALVRVPAWDLQHLFLGLCNVTRQNSSCLELVCEKWAHSLLEVDMAWASATRPLDSAVEALADKGAQSKLKILNLCGSSVSYEPVKKVLLKCLHLESINLSSCRALPRGMKRLYTGKELQDLKDSLDPVKVKAKEEAERAEKDKKKKDKESKKKTDSKSETKSETVPEQESDSSQANINLRNDSTSQTSQTEAAQKETNVETESNIIGNKLECDKPDSPAKSSESLMSKEQDSQSASLTGSSPKNTPKNWTLDQFSPLAQNADSSCSTPVYEHKKTTTVQASPIPRPDSQHSHNSSDIQQESQKVNNSWNLDQFKTTPTQKSEASPLSKLESQVKSKQLEQCSPSKLSPEAMHGAKQDIKNPNHWNYGSYSPMTRQEGQYSGQPSPYSAQPSPAQPSPYSAQPSPYSTQPSPYSSQQSPYSAQPSPDTSQMVKTDLQKSTSNWNLGGFSPLTKQQTQYSPHPSTHTSPDPGVSVKSDSRSSMSRQDRHHHSPYSPRPSMESPATIYPNRKSPGMGNFSPMMRNDHHIPSPDGGVSSRSSHVSRQVDPFTRTTSMVAAEPITLTSADIAALWSLEKFTVDSSLRPNVDQNPSWATPAFPSLPPARSMVDSVTRINNTLPTQSWSGVPPFESNVNVPGIPDQWTSVRGFSLEPQPVIQNTFLEQNVTFDALGTHTGFVDESFAESSRVD